MATTLSPRSCPSNPGLASSIRGGPLIFWPPSRALRLVVPEARHVAQREAGPRRRDTADAVFGPAPAASLHGPLDHHGAAVELEGGIAHHAVEVRDRVHLAAVGDRVPQGDVRGAARRL